MVEKKIKWKMNIYIYIFIYLLIHETNFVFLNYRLNGNTFHYYMKVTKKNINLLYKYK